MIRRNGISKKKKIGGKKRSPVERAEGQGLRWGNDESSALSLYLPVSHPLTPHVPVAT